MGVCGADPIAVTEGMEHLSPIGDDERATLQRLGCAGNTRMACSARMHGHGKVRVELEPHKAGQTQPTGVDDAPPVAADPDIRSVVIIGNGIAGITAAEHARRLHPTCEIHVLSREKHAPYNRMGIAHLINDRSGMQGLHLLPESWHRERRITSWLNTQVAEINVEARHVRLATNESIAFDRLILANGSSSWVPPIEGFGAPGSFVLREADEAMGLRDYVQRHGSRTAVVAGAGLLGLEAAHALQKLGLEVTVLSNTETILDRQLDAQSGQLLQTKLASQGIRILTRAEARTLGKDNRGHLGTVVLNDGSRLPADIFLACTGVKPNVELAKSCGIATGRGILVDKHMRTSLPDVYAAGDVAEHEGIAFGLWPVAVEQGEVAATNALGGHREYRGYVPATMLKVSGVDLLSVGNINAGPGETEIVDAQPECFQYRKLVLSSDRLVGAILFGYPEQASLIASLTKQGADLSSVSATLRRGDWGILAKLEMAAAA
jgi:NAD(P)H-nitrite reductase large subunit